MRFHLVFVVMLLLSLVASPAAERVALVIGNNAYQHMPKLANPQRDARAVAGALRALKFEVIALEDVTVEKLYEGLEQLKARAATAEIGLVYFAGHGVEINGKNYLLPVDAELATPGQLRTQAVSLDAVLADLDGTRVAAKIAILDCCRDDPLTRGWMANRSLGGRGLAELKDAQLPSSTMVMFSAGPGQVAADGAGENSPFTAALVKRLLSPGQSIFEAFLGTSDDVMTITARRQEPWVKFDGAGRVFREFVMTPGNGNMPPAKVCERWSPGILRVAGGLQLQNEGRIKPLAGFAEEVLMRFNGAPWLVIGKGTGDECALVPVAWFLDTLFKPELAVAYPIFQVTHQEVVEEFGLAKKGGGARYSYDEILVVRERLIERAQSLDLIDRVERTPTANELVDLAYNVREFEAYLGYFGFARTGVTLLGLDDGDVPEKRAAMSDVMATAPQVRTELDRIRSEGGEVGGNLKSLLEQVIDAANFSKFGLPILPPTNEADDAWLTAGNAIMEVMTLQTGNSQILIDDIKAMEVLVRSIDDLEAFELRLSQLVGRLAERAASLK